MKATGEMNTIVLATDIIMYIETVKTINNLKANQLSTVEPRKCSVTLRRGACERCFTHMSI